MTETAGKKMWHKTADVKNGEKGPEQKLRSVVTCRGNEVTQNFFYALTMLPSPFVIINQRENQCSFYTPALSFPAFSASWGKWFPTFQFKDNAFIHQYSLAPRVLENAPILL